jgi:hypothetical protein
MANRWCGVDWVDGEGGLTEPVTALALAPRSVGSAEASVRLKTYTRLTSTFADFSGNGFTHLLLLRETPF